MAANEGTLYCRPEFRGKGLKQKSSTKYCPECKMKRRGKNHDEGKHHKGIKITRNRW